jgi:hypothetical protein
VFDGGYRYVGVKTSPSIASSNQYWRGQERIRVPCHFIIGKIQQKNEARFWLLCVRGKAVSSDRAQIRCRAEAVVILEKVGWGKAKVTSQEGKAGGNIGGWRFVVPSSSPEGD